MTLEMLKYGSFKPTWVASDSKALPGYGGEVQGWADYKFAVQAIEKRESGMPDNEKKKLGPLSLRLVERLAGPALQVAKKIGLDRLSEAGGTKTLLDGLEAHLLPLQKQAALELYHAGMKEGILSRQHGESMSSYCLRRQSWWTQLQELDNGIQCSTSILGEQLLLHAGLGHLEQQMVRTGCQNDLSDLDKVSNILRDQFGNLHDRESRGKGGKGRFESKGRYDNKPWYQRNTGYYSETVDEKPLDETYYQSEESTHDNTVYYGDEEDYHYDEEWMVEDDTREKEIEEEVIAWYSTQQVDAQTCSAEDLEMVIEAVEVEVAAYYSKMNAENRGVSTPSTGNPYGGVSMPAHDRQAKVMAAKQRSRCRSCGQMGHWQRDPICPNRGKGSKGRGKRFGKGKSKSPWRKGDNHGKDGSPKGGKSPGKRDSGDKPRVVYFALHDQGDSGVGYMAYRGSGGPQERAFDQGPVEPEHLDQERQRVMELEVQRLMTLPQERIDEMLQQELAFMTPTSKATGVRQQHHGEVMPTALPKQPMMKSPPPKSHMSYRSEGEMPEQPVVKAVAPMPGQCEHRNITRRGTNAYVAMESCKDCGKILKKETKASTAGDKKMATASPGECEHPEAMVNWRGTNGYSWKWTCERCGMTETHKKEPGLKKPIPGQLPTREDEATSSSSQVGRAGRVPGDGGSMDECLCGSRQEWTQFSGLLHRMVENHIGLHGSVTQGEFYHIVSATCLCYHTMGSAFVRSMEPPDRPQHRSPGARSEGRSSATGTLIARSDGEIAGNNKLTFGRYKGYTFEDVYEMDESYVQFCLDEKSKGEAYCTSMARFQSYCEQRRNHEARESVAYMVTDSSTEEDEATLMYLDSGCNSTCHGEKWMQRYEQRTGYSPEWTSKMVRPMTGIGGAINALGVRKLYVGLETMEGYKVPGELSSTEIEDSNAPMLLSLQAQEALGLVLDLANMVVTSQVLNCTFKAIRGKNKLIGLKLHPGDFLDDGATVPVGLMADDGTHMTYQVKEVPRKGERWKGDSKGKGRGEERPPWRSRSPQNRGEPASSSAGSGLTPRPTRAPEIAEPEEEFVQVLIEEGEEEDAEDEEEEGPKAGDGVASGPHIGEILQGEGDYGDDDELYDEEIDETVRMNQEYVDEEMRRRGPLDEDTPPFAEEHQEDDFWEVTDTLLIRHHFEARTEFFAPNDSLSELPVDISRLGEWRTTHMKFVGTRAEVVHADHWMTGEDTPEEPSTSWVGSTEFELKPIDEELKMAKITWEDGEKKVLSRGQKKRLAQDVTAMENEDYAMWSTLRKQRIGVPKGWKALLEIFAGCAVLTSVFQSQGYECCTPLDILNGWDVHNPQHRSWAEDTMRREKPYLVSYAFVCGPWSPWQRMSDDKEKVNAKRRMWIPVFKWMYKMIKEQQERGGVSLMENPWTSEAWDTAEMLRILKMNLDFVRVDMCTMGLVDRESQKPHKKMTCLASDSRGIIEEFKGKLCTGDHDHQPLEGSNAYGPRCKQAGRYPEAAKIVNLHFPLIYIFARIYIPNLRKLKGKCKFYIFPKNVFFRRKIEDFCKNENFHFFLHTKNYYFFSISLVSSLDF